MSDDNIDMIISAFPIAVVGELMSEGNEAREEDGAEEDVGDIEDVGDERDGVEIYIKQAGRTPLLTAQEEIDLAKRMKEAEYARKKMAEGNLGMEKKNQLQIIINDGGEAEDHLIKANTRLVIHIAKKHMGRGVPLLDLIQEGNIGLIRGTKKFNYRRGNRFATHVTWWIRQAVTRAIADQARTIRIPVGKIYQISRLAKVSDRLSQNLGRDPHQEELAQALGISVKRVERLMEIVRHPLSLEEPIGGDDDETELGDFLTGDSISPDEAASQKMLRERIEKVFSSLPAREVKILQLRYGLKDGKSFSLEEVGKKMGITRERVRQIEAKALGRMRGYFSQED